MASSLEAILFAAMSEKLQTVLSMLIQMVNVFLKTVF